MLPGAVHIRSAEVNSSSFYLVWPIMHSHIRIAEVNSSSFYLAWPIKIASGLSEARITGYRAYLRLDPPDPVW